MTRSSASATWTSALVSAPARPGSSPAASRRRIASASPSCQRCALPRVSSAPAGADSASSTVLTSDAQSGARSPYSTPAPPSVVSSRTDRSSNPSSGSSPGPSGAPEPPGSPPGPSRSSSRPPGLPPAPSGSPSGPPGASGSPSRAPEPSGSPGPPRPAGSSGSPGSSSGAPDRDLSYIWAPSRAMSSCRAPALATPSRMMSAASRSAAGSLSVYSQITLPIESEIRPPSASAAATSGWAWTRRDQPTCPAAQPRVTPVLWTSQVRKEASPSAAGPCAAVNAPSIQAWAAVPIASPCSIWIRAPASSAAVQVGVAGGGQVAVRGPAHRQRLGQADGRVPACGDGGHLVLTSVRCFNGGRSGVLSATRISGVLRLRYHGPFWLN